MTDLTKVLIRTPKESEAAATVFPLIHQLKLEYPNSHIYLLVWKGQEVLYKIFPFEVFVYEFDDSELSLPAIHKYAATLHDIFNIDLFLDLQNDLKSSFLGFSFKAKARVGYIKGMNKFLLTHKIEETSTFRPDKKPLRLLSSYLKKDFDDFKVSGINKLEELKTKNIEELANLPPYFLIDSNNILEEKDFWSDFFRFFEGRYFIIWFNPEREKQELEEHLEFVKSLGHDNTYVVKTGVQEAFLKLLVHSIGHISNNLTWSYPSSYLGVKTFSLVKRATDLPFMEHFEKTPVLIEIENGTPLKWIGESETMPVETVDRLVNIFHDIYEL